MDWIVLLKKKICAALSHQLASARRFFPQIAGELRWTRFCWCGCDVLLDVGGFAEVVVEVVVVVEIAAATVITDVGDCAGRGFG